LPMIYGRAYEGILGAIRLTLDAFLLKVDSDMKDTVEGEP